MTRSRQITAPLIAAASLIAVALAGTAWAGPALAAPAYRTCAAVNAAYPGGVASTPVAAAAAVATGFLRPTVKKALYNKLTRTTPALDRPRNGIACEVRVPVILPSAVQSLTGTPTSSSSIHLDWLPPAAAGSPAAAGYSVTGSGVAAITGTQADITGLTPGTEYTFTVQAVSAAGPGTAATVTATTTALPTPAPTPSPVPAPTPSPPAPPIDLGDSESPTSPKLSTTYNADSPITARMQWNANYGYCGETSFITALMLNGGYTSQWTARSLALGGGEQWQEGSQLLVGTNGNGVSDLQVAAAMRLTAVDYDGAAETNTDQFLSWIKRQFLGGGTVIIGVYNNVPMLGESGDGDPVYDHVVPVVAVGSDHPLDSDDPTSHDPAWTYYNDDIITISDNGLYTPLATNVPGNSPENATGSAFYTFDFYDWQNTRSGANTTSSDTSTYDLYSAPIVRPGVQNYGVAITGIVDTTVGPQAAIPVTLTSDVNGEGFHNQAHMHTAPAATPMTLTATAHPTPGIAYNVYVYDNFADVPLGDFNDAAAAAHLAPAFTIPDTNDGTWAQTVHATTADTRIFRVVPVAPN